MSFRTLNLRLVAVEYVAWKRGTGSLISLYRKNQAKTSHMAEAVEWCLARQDWNPCQQLTCQFTRKNLTITAHYHQLLPRSSVKRNERLYIKSNTNILLNKVYVYIYCIKYIHICKYVHTYIRVYVNTCICVYMYTCKHVCVGVGVCLCLRVCVCVWVWGNVYLYVYLCIFNAVSER